MSTATIRPAKIMKQFFLLAQLLVLLSACELMVDVNVKEEKPRLTLNTIFTTDSLWTASLTLSNYILDPSWTYQTVDDAVLIIYEDDTPIDTLLSQGNGVYKSDSGTPQNEKTYQITATSATHGEVSSTSYIPKRVDIIHVETKNMSDAFNPYLQIDIKFRDTPDEINYYKLSAEMQQTYTHPVTQVTQIRRGPIDLESDDPIFAEAAYRPILILNDALFSGKEISLRVKSNYSYLNEGDVLFVYLQTLSKDLYDYETTYSLQQETSGNPIAQPVSVYNNINDGFGIFAGHNQFIYEYPQ
jgi:hypothetical protein